MSGTSECQPQCPLRVQKKSHSKCSTSIWGWKWTLHYVLFCISFFIPVLLVSCSVKFPVYTHTQNKGNSLSLHTLYFWRSQCDLYSLYLAPFLTACPAKWKVVAWRWFLMCLGNEAEIRLWEPKLLTMWLNSPLEVPRGGRWPNIPLHGKELCPTSHTLLNLAPRRVLMASQEIHCETQSICKRWWAQRLAHWVCFHQNAFLLVGRPSAFSAAVSLHDSCRPQHSDMSRG